MSFNRRQAAARLAALGIALPVSAALAQPVPAPQPEPEAEPATEIGSGRDAYEHMLAPVTINGQGPFQFLMDTGANTSAISRDLASRLMLAPTESAPVHTVVGVRQRPGVMIDHLQIGDRSRRSVRAATMPLVSGVDGVLGVDWLDGQRLVLGFKEKSIAIARSVADRPAAGSVVVPARRRFGQLTIVDADLSGRPVSAMIDTGSQATMGNDALRAVVGPGDRLQRVHMETLAGEGFSGELIYLPFLRLGGLQMGAVPVVHANVHVFDIWGLRDKPAIVLGMDLLTQFDRVSMDFGRSRVRFDLSDEQRSPAART